MPARQRRVYQNPGDFRNDSLVVPCWPGWRRTWPGQVSREPGAEGGTSSTLGRSDTMVLANFRRVRRNRINFSENPRALSTMGVGFD